MLKYKGTYKLLYNNGYKILFNNKTHIKFYYYIEKEQRSEAIEIEKKTKKIIEFTELDFLYELCYNNIIQYVKGK